MEEKLSAKMIYFHVTNDEKLQFMLDKLSEKNISCVEDVKGFYAPKWAENIVNEQFRYFKPSQPTARDKIKLDIDKFIYCSKNLEDLFSKLEAIGYQVRHGKYISLKAPEAQRSIRTKSLGDEYTEENLKRRIAQKDSYMKKTEEKIQSSAGVQRDYMVQIKQTIVLIYQGKKAPRKRNYNRPYTIENDYHINELAAQLQLINRDRITSGTDLENRYESHKQKLEEKQQQLQKTTAIKVELQDILAKAQYYFANCDKKLDSMGTAKLAAAKETLDDYEVTDTAEANRVLQRYRDCERLITALNNELPALKQQQNEYVKLMQTYANIQEGSYIDRLVAEEIKRQEKSL